MTTIPTGATAQSLLRALANCLTPGALITQSEETVAYECDGLTAFRQKPWAVVLPETETQVVEVLRQCHAAGVVVVPRGAGTSLSGGTCPLVGSVVLSLARMNSILSVDVLARTARVQPGVRNQAISDMAAPNGLFYAPDPSSQLACSLGGNVAENAGGLHCLKYGLTLHNVLRVRGITMDGEIIEVGSEAPDVPGLDLLPLIVGSEGMLAVVTEVTVRLRPKPPCAQVILASFDDVGRAADAVAAVIAAGIIPAALEMMDQGAAIAIEDCIHPGYDLDAKAILLCEADGSEEQVLEEIAQMVQLLMAAGAMHCKVSSNETERQHYWSGRKAALTAASRIAPDCYVMDGSVPRKHIGTLLSRIDALQSVYGLKCVNVFHAGDGNLHPIICFDGAEDEQWHSAEKYGAEILEACIELGGSVTGEHGVGVEKLDAMCSQFSPIELEMFHRVKAAFDPARLLNPDKAIPVVHRCAETGHLHVHNGVFPHSDLPRY